MALLSMGQQPKDISFGRTIRTQTMTHELLFPKRKPTELLLQGLRQKAGWVLVVCAVGGPRSQGSLGVMGVSPAHGGPGDLAPGSLAPGSQSL